MTAEQVSTWDMAVRAGEDPAELRPERFFDVGVDVATIVLFDAVALDAMRRLENADPSVVTPRSGVPISACPVPGPGSPPR
jgi:hypothetical protein